MRKWLLAPSAALVLSAPLVMVWEGKKNEAYLDPVGIPTACYGYTHGVQLGQLYTDAECENLLHSELAVAERAVDRLITHPIAPETKASLISFTYNVGEGNLRRSTLRRKMNAGDVVGACYELPKWIYAKGRKLQGLVNRRKEEMHMCLQGALR